MNDTTTEAPPRDVRDVIIDAGKTIQRLGDGLPEEIKAIFAQMRYAVTAIDRERDMHAGQLAAMRRQSTADGKGVIAIMPRTPQEAYDYARSLCEVGHVPAAYRVGGKKEGDPVLGLVALGIMKAMEVGMPPQTGLANIMPVNDRFTVWGDLAQALAFDSGHVEAYGKEFVLPDDFDMNTPLSTDWPDGAGVRVWFKRRGTEGIFEHTFTVGDAKRAKLWMNTYKKPWIESPWRMLFNRARAFALRDGFADCLMGLSIREEVEDMIDVTPRAAVDSVSRLGGFSDTPQPALEHTPSTDTPIPAATAEKEPVTSGGDAT